MLYGVSFAYTYIREDVSIPKNQKPLRQWQNNTDYKVERLDSFLKEL